MFATRQEARAAGWFSRRHETDDAHRNAQNNFRTSQSKAARKDRAEVRALVRAAAARPATEKELDLLEKRGPLGRRIFRIQNNLIVPPELWGQKTHFGSSR